MSSNVEQRKIAISVPATGEEEWQAVREPLMSGWLTQGPEVGRLFETAFAQRHGVKHALATTSCTTGLHLIWQHWASARAMRSSCLPSPG